MEFNDAHRAILDTLAGGGAFFFRQLGHGIGESELKTALWELIWAGWITGDTFAPVRAMLSGGPAVVTVAPRRTGTGDRRG
ncbi:putative ATP-dependent helicase domain protein [Mycobacterium xenopi 3993]|nr:putative ATP-dependent helicase domain protein [Mycobacterium xenopi 3993]